MTPNRPHRHLSFLYALQVLFAAFVTGCAGGGPAYQGRFQRGAVAADQVIASEAGAQMLGKGGNAVDAAVATSFTLSVVRPESCGMGGGGFMVIHLMPGTPARSGGMALHIKLDGPLDVALNYREMAPGAVGPDYYEQLDDPHASTHGGKAIGIPGSVAGLLYALDHFGTLDRATVMAPAIRAAERGFRADTHYVEAAREVERDFDANPEFKTRFGFVWKRYLKEGRVAEGDWIMVPEQAAALRLIADQGAAAFYEGPIADAIVEAVQRDGGPLTRDDLRGFKVGEVAPLRFTFMERTFLTMPPPSSGGVAMAEAMGILAQVLPSFEIDISSFDKVPFYRTSKQGAHQGEMADRATEENRSFLMWSIAHWASVGYVHALTESLKHAFADRSRWLGDPAFVDVPVTRLMSDEYLRDRAATFDPKHTLKPRAYGTTEPGAEGGAARDDHGTSHFCVIDQWGNAVACTETINLGFGSCLAVEKYGFILNDQMDDFTTRRGKANAFGLKQSDRNLPAPGKRPLSSMTPTIVLNQHGQAEVVAGGSGGPRIISGTMQAILNVVVFDATAGQAVLWPRIHHQWSPDVLRLEDGLMGATTMDAEGKHVPLRAALEALGHKVERTDSVANVQVITRDRSGHGWDAACDPRKGGRPAGH